VVYPVIVIFCTVPCFTDVIYPVILIFCIVPSVSLTWSIL
jgi:hypothetical protein